ncbi:hypothetical protein QAD02_008556 [Eretmocerus hayati]|uniref:Uncharacterized protein n=1 Tax=Eretmocerus hayati TaxID=131215 RepID=A0ACC2N6R5_9HYME|nr:hypothetical protein QAD02_008556 [Eretmocerus hayati]
MRTSVAWVDKVEDKSEQCIYDLCFNPSGTQLIVAAGQHVHVYESHDGALIQVLKGHRDVVYCVCYARDGTKFASGGADKTVIIWTSKLEGILKYSHNEAVQSMQFNPMSHQLLSCSMSDIALWSAELKAVQKHKSGGRVNCCAWTKDGQYMALGLASGYVSIRNKGGDERLRIDRSGESPIWSLAWSPSREDSLDVLCIGEWDGTLSFFQINGKMLGRERILNFIPLKITYFPNGQYIIVCGSNKQCLLLSPEGSGLAMIGSTFSSWTWSCSVHPDSSHIAVGCQDGNITNFELSWNVVHGLYKNRYAYRENMTDVIIQHLLTNQKVRIKCKDLIKKIAVYRDRLAVQLSDRVIIYEPTGNTEDMHYRIRDKLIQTFDCSHLVVTTNNLILFLDERVQSLSFAGVIEREWVLDSPICYIKVVGGLAGQERLLTGLKNGQVMEIYLDNPFPAILSKVDGAVKCIDISSMKEKLAVVNDSGILTIYDIYNDVKIQEFQDVISVAFNSSFEDMMCFSGRDFLAIKVNNFNEYKQRFFGNVVGQDGSKVYCLQGSSIVTVEIPLSSSMYQYLESEVFDKAYAIACLGVSDSDWFALGAAALDHLEFGIAYEAFARTRKLRYVDIASEIEDKLKSGDWSREACMATSAAAFGRLREAAKLYQKAGLQQHALDMYSDLRMFDIAQEFVATGNSQDRTILLRRRAEWAKSLGEPRAAAEMFLSAGDVQRAVKIISDNGWVDMLIKVGRQLDKAERDSLGVIAKRLKQLGATLGAAEIFARLGDDPDVADVLVDAHAWNEAFELAERNPKLRARVYGPYARWLAETGRFSEAQKAFQMAGQPEESISVLTTLAKNAVLEKRFRDASYFYWLLSQLTLDLKKNAEEVKSQFMIYYDMADVYYAYHEVHKYLEEPFTALMPEALFNISKFLLTKIQSIDCDGVSKLTIIYALVKQARLLGANKLAMQLLDRLRKMKIPKHLLTQVETWMIAIKSYPYRDPEELLPLCNRCSTYNALLPANNASGNSCAQCGLKFQYSFVMFEILPLVEFELESGITDEEAEKLIEEPVQTFDNAAETENQFTVSSKSQSDLFMARLVQYEEKIGGSTVTVGRSVLKSMDPSSVLIVKWPKPFVTRYYRNLLPDLQVTCCKSCLKLFHTDDYELALLRSNHCPFCRTPDIAVS